MYKTGFFFLELLHFLVSKQLKKNNGTLFLLGYCGYEIYCTILKKIYIFFSHSNAFPNNAQLKKKDETKKHFEINPPKTYLLYILFFD